MTRYSPGKLRLLRNLHKIIAQQRHGFSVVKMPTFPEWRREGKLGSFYILRVLGKKYKIKNHSVRYLITLSPQSSICTVSREGEGPQPPKGSVCTNTLPNWKKQQQYLLPEAARHSKWTQGIHSYIWISENEWFRVQVHPIQYLEHIYTFKNDSLFF